MAGLAAGSQPYQPRPETVAYLEEILTPEEIDWFTAWARPTDNEIHLVILETLRVDSKPSAEFLRNAILSRYPNYSASVDQVESRKCFILDAVAKPAWFHNALLNWPGPGSPPSEALMVHLERARPVDVRGRLSHRAGLARASQQWHALCLSRLRVWNGTGQAPCYTSTVTNSNGRESHWAVLKPELIRDYLREQLVRLRALVNSENVL